MQNQLAFKVFDGDTLRQFVNPKNPDCPYNRYIGNAKAVKRLSRAAFAALSRPSHLCNDQYFALIGPPSTGKTTLVKIHAKVLGLPFVEIQPQAIKRVHNIFEEIQKVCEVHANGQIKLREAGRANKFVLPPMIVFIDEVHALSDRVVQGLLKATEHNDCKLITEAGYEIDTKNVCWIIATTDRGLLFDAFDTRFEKIILNLYSKKEIEEIVRKNFPQLDQESCKLIAKYNNNIPREALSFARETILTKDMDECSWAEAIKTVAEERDIDEFGMTNQRVKILNSLGQRPIPANQLARIACCKDEELRKFIMVPLVCTTPDQPEPLVVIASGRGYCITKAGLKELEKRGLPHKGEDAMPKEMRTK
jgi:Holliday junction resolvasome RuvABC ATP-dependent DNA helicase subunit